MKTPFIYINRYAYLGKNFNGFSPEFSSFVTNLALTFRFENPNSIPKPSSKKQAILIACRHHYLINGRTTLVNTKGVVLSPKGQ